MNIQAKPGGFQNSKRRPVARSTFEWTEENVAIAERLWAEGYTGSAIGERFGVSRGSVTAMAAKYRPRFPVRLGQTAIRTGKAKAGKKLPVSAEWLRRASELWMQGMTAHAIAVSTGISSGAAYHRIHKTYPELFPKLRVIAAAAVMSGDLKSYIGNDRWVDRVPYTTFAGAVVSLPRVSILNGKEA
jgi:hypothetical protein